MDKVRSRPKGFAYVTFSSNEEAGKALLELNGQVLLTPFFIKNSMLLISYLVSYR